MNIRAPFSYFLNSSFFEYTKFVMAKEFRYSDNIQNRYPPSKLESASNYILAPLKYCVDGALKNVYKPAFIAAINVVGIGVITTLIYPDQTFGIIQAGCSPFFNLNPSMLKLGVYLISESVLTLMFLRSMSRLNQTELRILWKEKAVIPIQLGMVVPPARA